VQQVLLLVVLIQPLDAVTVLFTAVQTEVQWQ
jgi:hypothetical protein